MVAAGVVAGENRDAFLWNKEKKKEREREDGGIRDFYSTISMSLTYNAQPFIRLTPHT
jgi:hypothetical protein